MSTILLVDDESVYTSLYRASLQSRSLKVIACKGPKSALKKLSEHPNIKVFVVDLMMPSQGLYTPEETQNNLLTGALLARDIRRIYHEEPIIIFTSSTVEHHLDRLKLFVDDMNNIFVVQKGSTNPDKFSKTVEFLIYNDHLGDEEQSILSRFFSSLLWQPNFFGLGINLRKLISKK